MHRLTHGKDISINPEDIRRPNKAKSLITATRIRWVSTFNGALDNYSKFISKSVFLKWIDDDEHELSGIIVALVCLFILAPVHSASAILISEIQRKLLKTLPEDIRYSQYFNPKEKVNTKTREMNIRQVNTYQEKILHDKGISICADDVADEKSRALVLYYRGHQMDEQSCQLAKDVGLFLKYYIENGYSQLFNTLIVVYREFDEDFVPEFSANSIDVQGKNFEVYSSLFANVIHLSDGTPNFLPGTLPILANAPIYRWRKQKKEYNMKYSKYSSWYNGYDEVNLDDEHYVHLPLSFVNVNGKTLSEKDFQENPEDAFLETLKAVQRCERRMLKMARTYGKKKLLKKCEDI